MKKLIIILFLCVSAQTINAKPMWEVSSSWVCNLEFTTNILVDEKERRENETRDKFAKMYPEDLTWRDIYINKHEPWTYFLDFEKSILTNTSGNTFPIYDKYYYGFEDKNAFNNKNIIVTKSKDDERYPWYSIDIIEEFDIYGTSEVEFWMRESSGPRELGNEGLLKTRASKCNPVK